MAGYELFSDKKIRFNRDYASRFVSSDVIQNSYIADFAANLELEILEDLFYLKNISSDKNIGSELEVLITMPNSSILLSELLKKNFTIQILECSNKLFTAISDRAVGDIINPTNTDIGYYKSKIFYNQWDCNNNITSFKDRFPLIISHLNLHWSNNPLNHLLELRGNLQKDGILIGTLLGGNTLKKSPL